MATIAQVLRNVQNFSLQKAAIEAVKENENLFLQEHKAQLFVQGLNKKGTKLRRYASPDYADYKHALNPIPGLGNPDLFVTGAFARSRVIDTIGNNGFEVKALDSKTSMLTEKYGEDILGLSDETKQRICDNGYRDAVLKKVHEGTKL